MVGLLEYWLGTLGILNTQVDAIKLSSLSSLLEYWLGMLGILNTQVDAIKLSSLLEYWLGTLANKTLI